MYMCWIAELSIPAMSDIWGRVVDEAQVECHKGLRFLHVTTTRKPYYMDGVVQQARCRSRGEKAVGVYIYKYTYIYTYIYIYVYVCVA